MRQKLLAAAALTLSTTLTALPVRSDEPRPEAKKPATQTPAPKVEPKKAGFLDLLRALKESPGCLGIETALTSSGKQVIFAWFKDKQAVVAWYRGRLHQDLMGLMDAHPSRKALAELKDDDGPVMVIASITPSLTAKIEGFPMPISQIAIELYRPVPGGAAVNGTFAPKGVEIPGIKNYTPEPARKAEPPKPAGTAGPG